MRARASFLAIAPTFCVAVLSCIGTVHAEDDVAGRVAPLWEGRTPADLHAEYRNIFRHGNRNAASHLWASFILDRAGQMEASRLFSLFTGFCAVSGSPVHPSEYRRYLMRLSAVDGSGVRNGFMYYCCWPCVCDTEDFLALDTKTVVLKGGEERKLWFVVMGDPCVNETALDVPFRQPFDNRLTTLRRDAAEVRCHAGALRGAHRSDHGKVILTLWFDQDADGRPLLHEEAAGANTALALDEQPGRISYALNGDGYQDERDFASMCRQRAQNGYNSGMGEIFRKVAAITPLSLPQHLEGSQLTAE